MNTQKPSSEQAFAILLHYLRQHGYDAAAKELKFWHGADYNKMLEHWEHYKKNKRHKQGYDNYV